MANRIEGSAKMTTHFTTWTKFLLMFWAILFFTSNLPGVIEGKVFPVITNMTVEVSTDFPFSTIDGTYYKNRICDLEEIRWYIVAENGYRVRIKTNDIPIDQRYFDPGVQSFGPIEAKFPAKFLIENSLVVLVSNCHPFWYTITTIYP